MPGFGKGNKYMHKFEKDSKGYTQYTVYVL